MGQTSSSATHRCRSRSPSAAAGGGAAPPDPTVAVPTAAADRDHSLDLPDECLALIFHSLPARDRNSCSLVCRRWLAVDADSRRRLSLDARAALLNVAPSLLLRFASVSKLGLKCDRKSDSITDAALSLISSRCASLTRLKLRACRELTPSGMSSLAANCAGLRKLSCGSCAFGVRGILAVLAGCPLLEDLSVKRLRGLAEPVPPPIAPPAHSSLKSICLKELYNGQCFVPLITAAVNLRTLQVIRCSGDWDVLLEEITGRVTGITAIHIEKLQVGDRGLSALAACANLEVLHLVKNIECTDAGLAALAEKCRLLRKIHIDGWKTNRIGGDAGLLAVARCCPAVQELVLIGVNPTVLSLMPVAANCKNLERLALCGSETFGDAEISCIAAKCVALKKLCIKGCPISDRGMEALVDGCPNLVKVKVKKCREVTLECADWLRANRRALAVNVDTVVQIEQLEGSIGESDVIDSIEEQTVIGVLPSSCSGRPLKWKSRFGFLRRRNFFASTFWRWSRGHSNSRQT